MGGFFLYLLRCFPGAVCCAFGNNPDSFTWKEALVGATVMCALIVLLCIALLLIRISRMKSIKKYVAENIDIHSSYKDQKNYIKRERKSAEKKGSGRKNI